MPFSKYVLVLTLAIVELDFATANIFNTDPSSGTCLCVTSAIAEVYDKGCGNSVDKAVIGQCLKYYGLRLTCGTKQYFRADIAGQERWLEAHDLEVGAASKCNSHNLLGTNPTSGTCFCASADTSLYDNACGKAVGSVKSGTCMTFWGLRLTCGQSQYFAVSHDNKKVWIDGKVFTSPGAYHCSIGSGLGTVDFRGKHVSDAIVREKLHLIANYFGARLWVTSGDRHGNGHSHHDVGRAADFWIDGWDSGRAIFDRIRSSGILDTDFQVIWHGPMTCTTGEHIHIGRYGDGRNTCWVNEGISRSSVCHYNCM